MKIVEHVANVVDNIVFQPGLNTRAQSRRIARAAIIATLQFARDNASAEMIESGVRMDLTDGNAGEDAETRVSDVFRSMVDALIQEIGGRG